MPFNYSVSVAPLIAGIAALNAQNVLILADTGPILVDTGTTLPATLVTIFELLNTEIAEILADVTGIAGAAMRGTDNALPAADYQSEYTYVDVIANGAAFVPPSGTVIYSAYIDFDCIAITDWFYAMRGAGDVCTVDSFVQSPLLNGSWERFIVGPLYCDGTALLKNNTGAQRAIEVIGMSLT